MEEKANEEEFSKTNGKRYKLEAQAKQWNKNKEKKENNENLEIISNKGQREGNEKGNQSKILFWNVAELKNKEDNFWEYVVNFDTVGLLETWIKVKGWEKMKEKMPREFN